MTDRRCRRRPTAESGAATSNVHQDLGRSRAQATAVAEVQARLEALATNSAAALLGQLPIDAVLAASVLLAERAQLFLKAAA